MYEINKLLAKVIEDNNVDLLINNICMVEFEKGYHYGPHSHNSLEINYIIKGSCFMNIGNTVVKYRENECMIIYPMVDHHFIVEDNAGCSIIQIDFNLYNFPELQNVYEIKKDLILIYNIINHNKSFNKLKDAYKIRVCMECIAKQSKTKNNDDILLRLYFCQLFVLISRHIKKSMEFMTPLTNKYVKEAIKYINSRYTTKVKLENIADRCGISSRYLRKEFKKYMGMSMIDYITALRVNKSLEYLSETNKDITDIALKVGYSTPQFFNKMFKKSIGISPKQYREKMFRKV